MILEKNSSEIDGPLQPALLMSASQTVELAKQRIQDKLAAQQKQEKHLIEEKKRDLEFINQLQKAKMQDLKQNEEINKDKQDQSEEEDPLDIYMKEISTKNSIIKGDIRPSLTKISKIPENIISINKKAPDEQITDISQDKEAFLSNVKQTSSNKVTIMSGVARSSTIENKNKKDKGYVMEQDIDGLEYISDDEAHHLTSDDLSFDTISKMKTKSEMVFTDHTKVYYRPFRKNFYVEVPEISKMTNEGITN